jgi:hypothetical protein
MSRNTPELKEMRLRNWKKLTANQKHMVLMYFYRLRTDFGNIMSYIETREFIKLGVNPDDLPLQFQGMDLSQLWVEAMEVIGSPKKVTPKVEFFFETSEHRTWAREFLGTDEKVKAQERQDAAKKSGRPSSTVVP